MGRIWQRFEGVDAWIILMVAVSAVVFVVITWVEVARFIDNLRNWRERPEFVVKLALFGVVMLFWAVAVYATHGVTINAGHMGNGEVGVDCVGATPTGNPR
jgi:RsiW-degrading membrane proteinase PrsW (M82 family)